MARKRKLATLVGGAAVSLTMALGTTGTAYATTYGHNLTVTLGGRCLSGGSSTTVKTVDCAYTTSQYWTLHFVGYYTANGYNQNIWLLQNGQSGQCLENLGNLVGGPLDTSTCGTGSTEWIEVDDASGHPHEFALAPYYFPGTCLHGTTQASVTSTCDNAPSEWWFWT